MRILMLAPWFNIHSTRPLHWLLDEGHEVIFMDTKDPCPEGRPGYHFIPYPYAEEHVTISVLKEIHQELKPDIVHVHWVDERAYHCIKASLKPLVLSVWGSDINDQFLPNVNAAYRRMISQGIAGADLTIVDAPTMDKKCEELAGCNIMTEMLHLGLDTTRFRPGYSQEALTWKRKLNVPAHAKIILSQRAWGPTYGHHTILEAFALAAPQLPPDTFLLYKIYNRISYADNKSYEMEIRRMAIELGVSHKVLWLEEVPHEQLPHIYALVDAIINYPVKDTIPITFMEAASCEKPVISIRLPIYKGSFAERFFCMVEPGSIEDLATAIIKTLNEDRTMQQCSLKEARRQVVYQFDEKVYKKGLSRIYQNFAEKHS